MTCLSESSRKWIVCGVGLLSALLAGAAVAADNQPTISALEQFAECTDRWEADACLRALQVYVKAHPTQAFDAGKTVTMSLNHWAALPFFQQALAGKAEPARCADERLGLAVISGLGLPKEGEDQKTVALASGLLKDKCWNELKAPVLKAVAAEAPGSILLANACPLLAAKHEPASACERKAQPAAAPKPAAQRWETLDPRTLQIEGPAKVYRGEEGRKVTLVKVKGKNYYLIKFEGFRGPWEGKVLLHREDDLGDKGYDYWRLVDGDRYVSIVARKSWGSNYYEVYPMGDKGPFQVGYDTQLSQAANPKALLSEYTK